MVQYQATPDYYNDYIAHYGIKGMKWRKRLKGKYYSTKSKLVEKRARINRKRLGLKPDQIWDSKDPTYGDFDNPVRYDKGKANSRSGQTGSKNVQTTKVRTGITKVENRPIARKKKIVSGTKTPRKRRS